MRPSLFSKRLLASPLLRSAPTKRVPLAARSINVTTSTGESSAEEEFDDDFGPYDVILPKEPYIIGTAWIEPRSVPKHIERPPYAMRPRPKDEKQPGEPLGPPHRIVLGSEAETRIREAAKLAKKVREHSAAMAKVGVTTNEIDAALHDYIISHNAYPSPLLYQDFPKSCCTSINNILAHGIPDDRPLHDGDIINIDVTVYLNGYHGDTSQTYLVGDVDVQGRELVEVTNDALEAGIRACAPGKPYRNIGQAIQELVHRTNKYSISPQFTGHGIGVKFHHPPWIIHHKNEEPGVMLPGDCFTIEPIIVQGSDPTGWIFPDGWTASTENCARSAQAEHMILITETGAEVLTA